MTPFYVPTIPSLFISSKDIDTTAESALSIWTLLLSYGKTYPSCVLYLAMVPVEEAITID